MMSHFQAYLLEGLVRWNKDRASAVVEAGSNTYNSRLLCAINQLSKEVLDKPIDESFQMPNEYTGMVLFL